MARAHAEADTPTRPGLQVSRHDPSRNITRSRDGGLRLSSDAVYVRARGSVRVCVLSPFLACLCVYLAVSLFACFPVCLLLVLLFLIGRLSLVCQFARLSACLSVCLFVRLLSVSLFVCFFDCSSVLSACLFARCLFCCLFTCPLVYPLARLCARGAIARVMPSMAAALSCLVLFWPLPPFY